MKKLLMLVVVTVLSTALFANDNTNFVKTEKGVVFLKHVKVGVANTIIGTTFDGEKVKFTKDEVTSYTKNGVQYDKMSVVKDNCITEETAFMELVTYKNGFKVYKYEYACKGEMTSRHLVFNGDNKFVAKFNKTNKAHYMNFFNLTVNI